jgi:AP-3 complex subunit sigma
VLETNMSEIVAAINEMNKAKKTGGVTASSLSLKATESLRGFRH